MKTAQIIAAALILAASVSASAQSVADSKEITHGKTRAEVMAELKQAEAEGKAAPTGFVAFDAPAKATVTSGRTTVASK